MTMHAQEHNTNIAPALPALPVLSWYSGRLHAMSADGEIQTLSPNQVTGFIQNMPALVCHAPFTRSKIGLDSLECFDVLELYAFVYPAQPCVPTPKGLLSALSMPAPGNDEDLPLALLDITETLLIQLSHHHDAKKEQLRDIAMVMGLNGRGWVWSPFIIQALGFPYNEQEPLPTRTALKVWRGLQEWAEEAPRPPPSHHGITSEENKAYLEELLGEHAEKRYEQLQFSDTVRECFDPVFEDGEPHTVLAEAGTGVGKTMGYLAPAALWAEKNKGAVWISTFTKNLQSQIWDELDRVYPGTAQKLTRASIRKGRENYLCLLNFEDMANAASTAYSLGQTIAAGLMARWVCETPDGDLTGQSFHGWLPGLLGYGATRGLSDRRGECIHSACSHYHKCFVEKSIRQAKRSDIVIANHALVMTQAALAQDPGELPRRYIFDEGHHIFDAADSAFAAHLTARETSDLRRWIMGPEGGRNSRGRGLEKRIGDLIEGDPQATDLLRDILAHASTFTQSGWPQRLRSDQPLNQFEKLFHITHKHVIARAEMSDSFYSIECDTFPISAELSTACEEVLKILHKLQGAMLKLKKYFSDKLADEEQKFDADTRKRMESISASLERRGNMTIGAWANLLATMIAQTPDDNFIDWAQIEKADGKAIDVGFYRHHLDPTLPFAHSLKPALHGIAISSATLTDGKQDELSWKMALDRSGTNKLSCATNTLSITSPFNYRDNTKVIVIQDVNRNNSAQTTRAIHKLFCASKGGALGLFTAVQRLKNTHENLSASLSKENISLYAQHIDQIDNASLIDLFRDDEHACLLGTDAIRDGVDVPGSSLRLLVFDRVPWPRPNILHRARREYFGGRQYDEMITRLKLKQAFGRLIRKKDDRGVFVMLDSALPSRLYDAFPPDTEIIKTGIDDAAVIIEDFLC